MVEYDHDGVGPDQVPELPSADPVLIQAEQVVSSLSLSRAVSVKFIVGPISQEFEGVVCALDRSQIYGVYGDMTQAPKLPDVMHPIGPEEVFERIYSDPNRDLKYVFVEDWKREESEKIGDAAALKRALCIADELEAAEVVIALPNCGSQYYFIDLIKGLDGLDPELLSSDELAELREYCEGVRGFLDENPGNSIKEITFVWSRDYLDQLHAHVDIELALPSATPGLANETLPSLPRRVGRIIGRFLRGSS